MPTKRKSKKKDPNAPKKPKTAYFLFCDDNREKAQKELGGTRNASEVSKVLGRLWNEATDEEKKPYIAANKKLNEAYKIKFEEYKKNKPESESESESSEEDTKKRKRKTKVKKDPNAPKKPLSSYMVFSRDMRPKVLEKDPSLKVTEVAKAIGKKWKALTDEEKKPYIKEAEKLKKKYQKVKEQYDEDKENEKKKQKQESSDNDSEDESDSDSD